MFAESVNCLRTVAEVPAPVGLHTFNALPVVRGRLVTVVVVPGIDGRVGFPPALVVPLIARSKQLAQISPTMASELLDCPTVAPSVDSQLSLMFHTKPTFPIVIFVPPDS